MTSTSETAFKGRHDLVRYGNNARLLFALQLRYDIDDIHSVAETAMVDGPDDKGCDLVFVDRNLGVIIVAQGYESEKPREVAKPKKADSLAPAATWLFSRQYEELPECLRTVAWEVREAIGANEIQCIEFWFVHNVGESHNVRESMKTVEATVRNAIEGTFGKPLMPERIVATEVGPATQDEWYESLAVHILVTDEIAIELPGLFHLKGEGWDSVVTAVKASWLREQYVKYREKLFSANYREYLGLRDNRRRNEINHGIQETATVEPGQFWVYNNGVSAIVSDFTVDKSSEAAPKLTIRGLSIVNGAQTTGALGTLPAAPVDSALVPIRFIRCSDGDTITEIVRFNNSQNPLVPADFKSNDSVQRRLRAEFKKIPDCEYLGGRRGVERIRARDNLIPSETCGQALAAFHARPDIAYHNKADIWRTDELYQLFFCVHTTAPHVLFAYSLLKAIEKRKKQLRDKGDDRTDQEEKQFEFLTQRGATYLLTAAVAGTLESLLNRKLANSFKLSFGLKASPEAAIGYWEPIVNAVIPFSQQLTIGIRGGVKDRDSNKAAIDGFCQQVEAFRAVGAANAFSEFASRVVEH
jgi:hypothetical protein